MTVGADFGSGTGAFYSNLTVNGAGSMFVGAPATSTITIGVNQAAAANLAYWNDATLDLTGLAGGFSTDVTNFNIGVGSTTQGPGTVLLTNTANNILATTLTVGNTGSNNGRGPGTLVFGTGTNVVQANTINIGLGKNTPAAGNLTGMVKFASQSVGSPGTVTITDLAGTGPADITVGDNNGTATAGGAIGTLDLRGHVASVTADALLIGRNNMGSNSGSVTGSVYFDTGTFTVNTITMAAKSGAGTGAANASLNIGGGSFTVNSGGSFALASRASAGSAVGTLNVTGGTFTSNVDILDGGPAANTTTTVTLDGGTLDMTGHSIGGTVLIDNLNFQSGFLKNVAQVNNGAALNKISNGTLILTGTNAYTGATTVTAGILNVQSNTGLGAVSAGTSVANNATLQLQGDIDVGAEALTLNGGAAIGQPVALVNVGGANSYAGAVTLAAASSITAAPSSTLTLTGGVATNGVTATFNGTGTTNVDTVGISGAAAGSNLVVDGATLNLNAANTYAGATTVSAGRLTVTGTVLTGSATVSGTTATLELARSGGPATPVGLDVSNAGTLEITTLAQELGDITGAGDTTVAASAGLTVNSIVQDTLTIGAGGSVTIRETPVAAGAAGANAVPEPGTWVLIGAGLLSWLAFRRRRGR